MSNSIANTIGKYFHKLNTGSFLKPATQWLTESSKKDYPSIEEIIKFNQSIDDDLMNRSKKNQEVLRGLQE